MSNRHQGPSSERIGPPGRGSCVADGRSRHHEWPKGTQTPALCSQAEPFLVLLFWHNFLDTNNFSFHRQTLSPCIASAHCSWKIGHVKEATAFSVFLTKLIHIFLGLVPCLILSPVMLFTGQTPSYWIYVRYKCKCSPVPRGLEGGLDVGLQASHAKGFNWNDPPG